MYAIKRVVERGRLAFVGYVFLADRIELPTDDEGSFFFWRKDEMILGLGPRNIGVRVFEVSSDSERELLPISNVKPFMDDFTQADTFRVEEAA